MLIWAIIRIVIFSNPLYIEQEIAPVNWVVGSTKLRLNVVQIYFRQLNMILENKLIVFDKLYLFT